MSPYEEMLAQFVENEVMCEAVKAHLLSRADLNTVIIQNNMMNEVIGQVTRGRLDARNIIIEGFTTLDIYRRSQKASDKPPQNHV